MKQGGKKGCLKRQPFFFAYPRPNAAIVANAMSVTIFTTRFPGKVVQVFLVKKTYTTLALLLYHFGQSTVPL
jgi:hypothetical protein